MKKIQIATVVSLSDADRAVLEGWSRSFKIEHRLRERAQIVLLCGDGLATRAVAREVVCTPGTASRWRIRYVEEGLAGLKDHLRTGKPSVYTTETNQRILAKLGMSGPERMIEVLLRWV